jgi:hypothetical protein
MAVLVERDDIKTLHDAYVEIYKRLRDGDLATPENAKEYIDSIILQNVMTFHQLDVSVSISVLESQLIRKIKKHSVALFLRKIWLRLLIT